MGKKPTKNKTKKNNLKQTRKELRKEKRQQKKLNKNNFFSKNNKKKFKNDNTPEVLLKSTKKTVLNNTNEFSPDEYESDLSNTEVDVKISKINNNNKKIPKPNKRPEVDRYVENQKREIKKQKELEHKMKKQRISQLKSANEDEVKVIRKLEKKLKIDKHRNEKSVHKMFNDGLDYALELCLPENIEKMYSAAKDAGFAENSDDNFQEDLCAVLGTKCESIDSEQNNVENKPKLKLEQKKDGHKKLKTHMNKLKKAEQKYFVDSDFSGVDSELENSLETASDNSSDNENTDTESSEVSELNVHEADNSNDENANEKTDDEDNAENTSAQTRKNKIRGEFNEDGFIENSSDNENVKNNEKLWEDIYGRKRDADGNVIKDSLQKYIPPQKRNEIHNADLKRDEKLERLKKQCKGFLNRLSEANIYKISNEIEQLFMKNSRFDMNNALSDLIFDALISNVISKERIVLEYTMLIAILHANIGSEIGAHFLQTLILKFDNLVKKIDKLDIENKELDNIVFILSHLYTYKIYHHSLIFAIMKILADQLTEKSVECILLILKSIGFQLRKDDPSTLKEFIFSIQKQANSSTIDIKENPRYKFMLEILNAIKNNNVNKIPNYDPELAEHLKKKLKSLLSDGKHLSTLNITMDDLLKVDEKGKWWVVGSAWSGNVNDIGSAKLPSSKHSNEKFSDKLLELARQQRMNTEDRRNVFCIVMSAADYIDAFERLLHLSLKDQRIIASIIIHCCLSEKKFNLYYGVLAQKFCEYDRKYQLAIQFATWDRIKDIDSTSKQQVKNLAQFLTFIIVNGAQPISILKIIEFAELDKLTLRLVRQIILGILLGNETQCQQVFERIAPSIKLNNFKDSIRLFINHFLLKNQSKIEIPEEQLSLLKTRINLVNNILAYSDSKLKF